MENQELKDQLQQDRQNFALSHAKDLHNDRVERVFNWIIELYTQDILALCEPNSQR